MTPTQREEAQRLFREAAAANTSDIARWLQERTTDRAVQQEVQRLIAVAATLHDATPPRSIITSVDPFLGREVGGFKIDRLIGVGGMGRVYAATGGNPPRFVALKLLARAAIDENTLRRFEREVRILATLDHPNVARIIDSGVVADGATEVPWLAMELIEEARTIIEYAEDERLTMRARLGLIALTCDGVAAGHEAGFVHRDLKPQNILVGKDGQPKVIDFGVARSSQNDISAATVRTDTGQLIGTMQYMSPEQFRADPRLIDKRVDVYSLGAVLFELLTGCHPYDVRGLPVHEAARVVCEGRVAAIGDLLPDLDDRLEEIVTRALSREKHLRFDDASMLASAVRQWLEMGDVGTGEMGKLQTATRAGAMGKGHAHPRDIGSGNLRGRTPKGSWFAWAGLAMLAAGVIVAGLISLGVLPPVPILFQRARDQLQSPTSNTVTPSKTLAVESVRVESVPVGATIFLDGTKVGTTPSTLLIRWAEESASAEVRIELDGYQPSTTMVSPDPRGKRARAVEIRVELEALSPPGQ
ncbi:MAG: PEGA domain-containing protein [Phycisphaerales bacterium]|nr:PEGA domain-containing protein [Phycisphaerales bacterium]